MGSEQRGPRPVVVLSDNTINTVWPICVIVPLTSKLDKANREHRIRIPASEIIPEPDAKSSLGESVALTEQIRCISRKRLDPKRIAKLKMVSLAAVEAGIKYVLRLP